MDNTSRSCSCYLHSVETVNHHGCEDKKSSAMKKQKSLDKMGHLKVVLGSRVPFVFTSCIAKQERRFSTILERGESVREAGRIVLLRYTISMHILKMKVQYR